MEAALKRGELVELGALRDWLGGQHHQFRDRVLAIPDQMAAFLTSDLRERVRDKLAEALNVIADDYDPPLAV
jgi:hypothetical protein